MLDNGHKRVHALKFQSVIAPNGMIANLYGPVEGQRHDAGMLRMSGLLTELNHYVYIHQQDNHCASMVIRHILSDFISRQHTVIPIQQKNNKVSILQ